MIDDPVLAAIGRDARRAEHKHDVIGKLLHPRLVEKKQVAGLGLAPITADEYAVEILQRAAVRELGKSPFAQIAFMERSKVCAKDFLAELVPVQIKPGHIRRDSFIARPHFLKP